VCVFGCQKPEGKTPSTPEEKRGEKETVKTKVEKADSPKREFVGFVQIGETKVEALWFREGWYQTLDYAQHPATVIVFKITNASKTKVARYDGWQGKAKIEDEHGNAYKPLKNLKDVPCFNPIFVFNKLIAPGEIFTTYVLIEQTVAVSKELKLTLPPDPGSTEPVLLRVERKRD
jgi:hypothetical protein